MKITTCIYGVACKVSIHTYIVVIQKGYFAHPLLILVKPFKTLNFSYFEIYITFYRWRTVQRNTRTPSSHLIIPLYPMAKSPQPLEPVSTLPSTSTWSSLSDSTQEWDQRAYFCSWLMSLNMMFSRFIHVATNNRISLSFWGWPVFHCNYSTFKKHFIFIFVLYSQHLGYFHILAMQIMM